ncbi:hypothetical protein HG535_0B03990 [Zygotorulaspora mrakii]|uniref:Nucleolar protein SWM2 n=1 Tax=Zygotorulaspora mrakii TaxID=42260 RepID=A0A7H9B052_ZYGMR|nr:uncharacterized protein HG535_0B03990 [Zygotorulaspora mrakii]QLG71359.1 hypothetical protein HG535_0B03990 [Zygotorulaspora mrakii]
MTLEHTSEKLQSLLNSFTNTQVIPKSYSELLLPFYKSIALNEKLRGIALSKCRQTFSQWENYDANLTDPEAVQRCLDLWLTIKGQDYNLTRSLPSSSNIIIEDIEVTNYVGPQEFERLEFHPVTHELLSNPLSNLIVEEVEATQFVDMNKLTKNDNDISMSN